MTDMYFSNRQSREWPKLYSHVVQQVNLLPVFMVSVVGSRVEFLIM